MEDTIPKIAERKAGLTVGAFPAANRKYSMVEIAASTRDAPVMMPPHFRKTPGSIPSAPFLRERKDSDPFLSSSPEPQYAQYVALSLLDLPQFPQVLVTVFNSDELNKTGECTTGIERVLLPGCEKDRTSFPSQLVKLMPY
jgi:hypothetical protein